MPKLQYLGNQLTPNQFGALNSAVITQHMEERKIGTTRPCWCGAQPFGQDNPECLDLELADPQ